ncbi:ANTAR domain-containing protein [Nocardioides sp.]|uniref:ANTAR domain-containing protein n=1 Tax=Nocardioides sp. TaxID=35761 RepID=UPI0025D2C512|nr:ANTAR domain-containing protein [Nocardioides sp.]
MDLNELHPDAVFRALPRPTVLLDTDFVIRAANDAYLAATARSTDELVDVPMFDAFPDNPDDSGADGVANLNRSLEQVARSRHPHNMLVQRYDILDSVDGRWMLRYWSPLNIPVLDDGRVVGLLHQVEDITPLEKDLRRAMEGYRDIVQEGPLTDGDARRFADAARAFARSATDYQVMAEEIMNLRRALTSRATIDQAKGIVMAERRCTPEAAFEVLAALSQDTNVKLIDVAAALVYKAQGPAPE